MTFWKNRQRHFGRVWTGFTLLEVLISLAIFAIAAVVLAASYISVLSGYDSLNKAAPDDADVRLVRATLLTEPDRKKIEEGGDLDLPDGGHARWKATLDDMTVADLFTVHFSCELSGGSRTQPVEFKQDFVLLRPTWSDPAVRQKLVAASLERITKINTQLRNR